MERFCRTVLPPAVHRYLFSRIEAFSKDKLLIRALFGAVSGTILFLAICYTLPLTFNQKLAAASIFISICTVVGALSSSARCCILLMFPSMFGSRGQTYLVLLTLLVLCRGPVYNMERNMEAAALSLSCNLDLQVQHSKLLWKQAIKPSMAVTEEIMDDEAGFQAEVKNVSKNFKNMRDEIASQYGYDFNKKDTTATGDSTQEQFIHKTMMQCDNLVEKGIRRCVAWFDEKWNACMQTIKVPILNHILCVTMKFPYLCDIMRVMIPWCRDQIPVEGNFGQLFDQLNSSIDLLSREFRTKVVMQDQKEQDVLGGAMQDWEFSQSVRESFQRLKTFMEKVLDVLEILRALAIITIFTKAFGYLRQYRRDIRFDNMYITSYFRRIDAHRKKMGRCFLLPPKRSEEKMLINPLSPKIHYEELRQVSSVVFQVLGLALLAAVLLFLDFSLFHMLDIISRHTVTQFNITGGHQMDITVDGDSMMAKVLRKMVSAFNSSHSFDTSIDNQVCVFPPSSLSADMYISCVCCILLVALFVLLQVYVYRLRQFIAASYHQKREKERVLFLYNVLLLTRKRNTNRRTNRESEENPPINPYGSLGQQLQQGTPNFPLLNHINQL